MHSKGGENKNLIPTFQQVAHIGSSSSSLFLDTHIMLEHVVQKF